MECIRVFTDGSCSNNGRKNAKAGFGVYFGENDPRNVSKRVPGELRQTNNVGEILEISNIDSLAISFLVWIILTFPTKRV